MQTDNYLQIAEWCWDACENRGRASIKDIAAILREAFPAPGWIEGPPTEPGLWHCRTIDREFVTYDVRRVEDVVFYFHRTEDDILNGADDWQRNDCIEWSHKVSPVPDPPAPAPPLPRPPQVGECQCHESDNVYPFVRWGIDCQCPYYVQMPTGCIYQYSDKDFAENYEVIDEAPNG